MIHVSFPLYDLKGTYSKYVATAMASIFENTKESVMIHLLHDKTLTPENRENFIILCNKYTQQIRFYSVQVDDRFISLGFTATAFTVGTLFRLYLPEIIAKEIDKVIYLDADILFHLDIKELWNENIGDFAVAAVRDVNICNGIAENPICQEINLSSKSYFNAGVLVLNLNKIRKKYNLPEQCIEFFLKYPEAKYLDQDALNSIFQKDCIFLPTRYNSFVSNEKDNRIAEKIYHFAGEKRAFQRYQDIFDHLFWKYFLATPWCTASAVLYSFSELKKDIAWLKKFFFIIQSEKKKVFFGAGVLSNDILPYLHVNNMDYYVDNDSQKWGKTTNEIPVYSPDKLKEEDRDKVIIIVTTFISQQIIKQLEGYGFQEEVHFFAGEKLIDS